jgi:hypothetical protein
MFQKASEDIDYELTPTEDVENEQAWDVRILRGPFTETVIRFGNIALNETEGCLNFNFMVVSSPDETLNEDREDLQVFVGDILESVLENAISNGSLLENERTTDTE